MRGWRFLSSVATISDASYVRFQGSLAVRENRRYFGLSTAAFLLWTLTVSALADLLIEPFYSTRISATSAAVGWVGHAELAGLFTSTIAGLVVLILLRIQIRRNFKRTLEHLLPGRNRLADTVSRGGIFQKFALGCHDDVWKEAVASLLPTAHAVLMDLRAFRPNGKAANTSWPS